MSYEIYEKFFATYKISFVNFYFNFNQIDSVECTKHLYKKRKTKFEKEECANDFHAIYKNRFTFFT